MTGANVLNWSSVSQGQTLNASAAGTQSKIRSPEAASVFASLMSGNYAAPSMQSSVKTEVGQKKTGENSFDQYSYRGDRIEPAQSATIDEKLSDSAEDLEDFKTDLIQTVAEDLQVDEKDVTEALESLGMTAFDLLIPQNLTQVVSQITGEESPAELLVNAQFVDLMQDMDQMGAQLVQIVDVQPDQLGELVAEMDILENPIVLPETTAGEMIATADAEGLDPASQTVLESALQTEETGKEMLPGEKEVAPEQKLPEMDPAQKLPEQEQTAEIPGRMEQTGQEHSGGEQAGKEWSGEDPQAKATVNTRTGEDVQQTPIAFHVAEAAVEEMPVPETDELPYLSMDTMDLIEQIAENARVSVSEGTTSMEMQLNPENLGKVYLQVSSKEGVVNASITASNEEVRAALEAQVADLRQSLNQAGVKVDAIEVTVASHEFERNLEQNQNGGRQQGERQQEQASQRRNINLSSMDELTGVMTEEEALVAQIMRDNGNSVDLTA